jgi:hypothetical protein
MCTRAQGFFFLGRLFLPVVAEIIGFREISEIPAKYRPRWFERILKFKNGFRPKFAEIFEKSQYFGSIPMIPEKYG